MGNPPITFIRQVLAIVTHPPLLESAEFPEDAKSRAREILKGCKGGSVGSYSESPGLEIIRRHVAEYIKQRDGGIESDWQKIILCAGASEVRSRHPTSPPPSHLSPPGYPGLSEAPDRTRDGEEARRDDPHPAVPALQRQSGRVQHGPGQLSNLNYELFPKRDFQRLVHSHFPSFVNQKVKLYPLESYFYLCDL